MKKLLSLLDWMQGDGRRAALFLALGSAGVLLAALYYQYVVKLLPCELCYLERKPHLAIVALGVLAFLLRKPRLRAAMLGLMALLAVGNAGLSLYHVGIEQHWWEGLKTCSTPASAVTTLEQARALLVEEDHTIVPCDKAVWWFLGISMAGWNGIISLCMAGWAAFAMRRSLRNAAP